MDIGKEEKVTVIEPLESPVPNEAPTPAPAEPAQPVEVPERDRELVPA